MKTYLIKEEKGAVSLLVFVTVMSLLLILTGSFLTITTLRKSQLESDLRIQELYGSDVNIINEIYEQQATIANRLEYERTLANELYINSI